MTQASLYRNYEYGVRITDPVSVRQIAADIREYSSLGTRVSLSELDKLTEIARTLQQKYAGRSEYGLGIRRIENFEMR